MIQDISIYIRLISVQIRSQLQYRASFLFDIFTTGVTAVLAFVSLALVLQRFGSIAGWTLGEVAFLFGMIEMSFGAMDMIFSGFDPDVFSVQVREGRFDQLMLRPVGLAWQVLGSRFLSCAASGASWKGWSSSWSGLSLLERALDAGQSASTCRWCWPARCWRWARCS